MSASSALSHHPLRDGGRAILRPARPEDRAAYVAAVDSLSETARFQRFFRPVDHLAEREIDRLMDLDDARQVVWLAIDERDRSGLGAARYVVATPGTAEMAIAVLDRCQGLGLGGALLDRVIASARAHGLGNLVAESLADNRAVAGLLRSRGFGAETLGVGVIGWHLAL